MAGAASVGIFMLGYGKVNLELLVFLCAITSIILGTPGFINHNGLNAEDIIMEIIRGNILSPKTRVYQSENAFEYWEKEYDKENQPKRGRISKRKVMKSSLNTALGILEETAPPKDNSLLIKSKSFFKKSGDKKPKKEDRKEKTDKNSKKKEKLIKLEEQAKEINSRSSHADDGTPYIPTKAERKILKKYVKAKEEEIKAEKTEKVKALSNQNKGLLKMRKQKSILPKTVQETIPYIADYSDGIMEVEPNVYSKIYRMKDINYGAAKESEQIGIFIKYSEFLNSFSEDVKVAICIDNKFLSESEQEEKLLFKMENDNLDMHRIEANSILRRQLLSGKNNIRVEKYLTVTLNANTPIEAFSKFKHMDEQVRTNLNRIGSKAELIDSKERLEIYHDKFRKGREGEFDINFDFIKESGISTKDYIAPSAFVFNTNHFNIDNDYYRSVFINNLPSSLSDDFLAEFTDNDFSVTTTISIKPVALDKGIDLVQKRLNGIEADKIREVKKASESGYDTTIVNHNLKKSHEDALDLLEDMQRKNQKMFFVTITALVHGATKEELDENTKILASKARKHMCQLQTLIINKQQEEGMKQTLPFGYTSDNIKVSRPLTTESTGIFMPFHNEELQHNGGIYYGLNQISRNAIFCDRLKLSTPSGLIFGIPGSGKSFAIKRESMNIILKYPLDNVIVADPENEYGTFLKIFGATVIKLSVNSTNYINPMDMSENYGLDDDDFALINLIPLSLKKDKALKKKSQYLMGVIENMLRPDDPEAKPVFLSPSQRTIVDECVTECYQEYLAHDFDPEFLPTLVELQKILDKHKSTEGKELANSTRLYTTGNMNYFAHKTNVDTDNRIVVFNMKELSGTLRNIAQTVMSDFVWNRMTVNKYNRVNTHFIYDEIHLALKSSYSASFVKDLYKRGRKHGLIITGITQNVAELINSPHGKDLLTTSKFIMMLNQASENLGILADTLKISETLQEYIFNAEEGSGLICADNTIVPFIDRFPQTSYLYALMSTKFGEKTTSEINALIDDIMREMSKSSTNIEENNIA